ncbi:hypothetical protein OEW28_14230 [Defluviimonas sp. WL0002]|uniref:Major facilitator superfamily (MFS) profile domain-containing protein n=1 Tax=Albidovulum marisflavi TaxID=2984159 RepID=A0ABT2ZF90_9RHOB|nr:hypothetical protein [Defluviimonas sp. WL0002]MCV2869789.1 hypothetical protein [Defluviimonas sp. WL0002]
MFFGLFGPLVASILYVIVMQKAGFRGAILAVAFSPLLGAVLSWVFFSGFYMGGGLASLAHLVFVALSLAPLLVLAFMSWPPVGSSRSRTTENSR